MVTLLRKGGKLMRSGGKSLKVPMGGAADCACCGGCSFHCTTCPDSIRLTLPILAPGHPCCAAISGTVWDIPKSSGPSPCVYQKTSGFGGLGACTLDSITVTITVDPDTCFVSFQVVVLAPSPGIPLNLHTSANSFSQSSFNAICDGSKTYTMTGDSGACTPTGHATVELL
jgi:hypothetical protein